MRRALLAARCVPRRCCSPRRSPRRADRGASAARAEEALERAQRLADGRGVRTGRELTPRSPSSRAARRRSARADRARGRRAARAPDRRGDIAQPAGRTTARDASWQLLGALLRALGRVDRGRAAARGRRRCPTPDYIDDACDARSSSPTRSRTTQLGWRAPVSDGTRGGDAPHRRLHQGPQRRRRACTATPRTDPAQRPQPVGVPRARRRLRRRRVPDYAATHRPMQVTAAHEYNHVLQFAYDVLAGPGCSSPRRRGPRTRSSRRRRLGNYMADWAGTRSSRSPPTRRRKHVRLGDLEPLPRRATGRRDPPGVGRLDRSRTGTLSAASPPHAYMRRSPRQGGYVFAGVRRSAPPPPPSGTRRQRVSTRDRASPARSVRAGTLTAGGGGPCWALIDRPQRRSPLYTVPVPAGTWAGQPGRAGCRAGTRGAGSRSSDTTASAVDPRRAARWPAGGGDSVSLANPGGFTRITAVLVNADVQHDRLRAPAAATGTGRATTRR